MTQTDAFCKKNALPRHRAGFYGFIAAASFTAVLLAILM